MFKNAYAPLVMITVVVGGAAVGMLLHRTGCSARPGPDHGWITSRLSYSDARAKLLRCPRCCLGHPYPAEDQSACAKKLASIHRVAITL